MILLIDNYDSFTYNLYQQLINPQNFLQKDEMQGKKSRPTEAYGLIRRGGSDELDAADRLLRKTLVVEHDKISIKEITKLKPKKILISPGPGRPEESGISPQVIKTFHKDIPILGVCLGHELIGELFGARVLRAKKILHGKTSQIQHSAKNLFTKIPQNIPVARYHSLILDRVPENFTLEAWTSENEIMAISHKTAPLHGIQFHPESFMTSCGNQIIQNFLNL